MEIYGIHGNPLKSKDTHGNLKKSVESMEIQRNYWNPWKSIEIHGDLKKSVGVQRNRWNHEEFVEIQRNRWKKEFRGNLRKSVEI